MTKNKIMFIFLILLIATALLLAGCPGGATKTSGTTSLSTTTLTTAITTGLTEILTGKIAFESYRDSKNDMNTEIYTMNPDGSNQKRITPYTDGGISDTERNPVWSPKGDKIIFTSSRVNGGLFVVNPDGTGEVQLTSKEDQALSPSWSPDGSKIAFASYRTGDYQIYIMNADGSNQTRLTKAKEPYDGDTLTFTYSAWSPDGSKILSDNGWGYSGHDNSGKPVEDHGGIYVFSVNTGEYTQLTHNYEENAIWSPDGSKIACFRQDFENSDDDGYIYVMNSDGSGLTRLTSGNNPAWSPDGSKIAFTSNKSRNGLQLYVINPDGSGELNLMSTLDNGSVFLKPSWSPDGKKSVFEYNGEIYFVNSDGSGLKKITKGAYSTSAVIWSPK